MNALALRQKEPIPVGALNSLVDQMRARVGIRVNSPQAVIQDNVFERMAALEISELNEYLALLRRGIGAQAEWLEADKSIRYLFSGQGFGRSAARLSRVWWYGLAPV